MSIPDSSEAIHSEPESSAPSRAGAEPRIAIMIPCHNEELTVAQVVNAFRGELPDSQIYVCDNNSTDRTVEEALAAGARVFREPRQGKGYVVKTMFKRIEADIYVMVDGDGTYPPDAVHRLIEPIRNGDADMVIGSRLHHASQSQFRWINRLGNRMFLFVLRWIFGTRLTDLLSGYRSFNHDLAHNMPLFAGGFETEVEMTIKTLHRSFRIAEIPVDLVERPVGSHSKIRVVRDGVTILSSMLGLFRDYKPLTFFGGIGLVLAGLGLIPGAIVIIEFTRTGLVGRMPSAMLAVGLVLAGMLSIMVGLLLHTIAYRFQEVDHQLQIMMNQIRGRLGGDADRDE